MPKTKANSRTRLPSAAEKVIHQHESAVAIADIAEGAKIPPGNVYYDENFLRMPHSPLCDSTEASRRWALVSACLSAKLRPPNYVPFLFLGVCRETGGD